MPRSRSSAARCWSRRRSSTRRRSASGPCSASTPKTGKELWQAPLTLNPWGGPSVQGDTVVVTGSSIGYDPKALKGAKGVVAAFDLATGKEKWKKDVPGGVVSCAALGEGRRRRHRHRRQGAGVSTWTTAAIALDLRRQGAVLRPAGAGGRRGLRRPT